MKVVPDYLEGYLDLERFIYLVLLGVAIWFGYHSYTLQTERKQSLERARTVAQKLPVYQELKKTILKKRSPRTNRNIQANPLSYLEEVVPEDQLTNLEPLNPGDNDYRYELRIEQTNIREALSLLSDLEQESQVSVDEFTLVRESFDGLSFHTILRFQIVV
jgi:hypothetical protein